MRQCSKCRSRDLSEIDEDEFMSVSEGRASSSRGGLTQGVLNAEAAFLSTDPDIIAKRKELEIAKLDRMIAEERKEQSNEEILSRVILDFKKVLFHLSESDFVEDPEFYEWMMMACPFCGAEDEEGMTTDFDDFSLKCRTYGKEVI